MPSCIIINIQFWVSICFVLNIFFFNPNASQQCFNAVDLTCPLPFVSAHAHYKKTKNKTKQQQQPKLLISWRPKGVSPFRTRRALLRLTDGLHIVRQGAVLHKAKLELFFS